MYKSDLRIFSRDADQFGQCVARTQRLVARLLQQWVQHHNDKRQFLPAIEYDKLVELFCRIWDKLCDFGHVRSRSALISRNGFHGPGRTLEINRLADDLLGKDREDRRIHKWAFATELAEKLIPLPNQAQSLYRLEGDAWSPKCRIYPNIENSQWTIWLKDGDRFITSVEEHLFGEISEMIKPLDPDEIRALGCHSTAEQTIAAIKFNVLKWQIHFQGFLSDLTTKDHSAARASYELVTLSREIVRKGGSNRAIYIQALQKIDGHGNTPEISSAVSDVQHTDKAIWDDPEVERVARISDYLKDFSIYLRRCCHSCNGIDALTKNELSESELAVC